MKITTLLLTLYFVPLSIIIEASDFLEEYKRLKTTKNDVEIQKLIADSASLEENNPDYYATAGNYWWQLSQSISLTTKQAEGDDASIRDSKSGKEVGSISSVGRANPEIPKKALSVISEGARRFPYRADIILGQAHIQQEMGKQKECIDTLLKLLKFSKENPNELRWTAGTKLPSTSQKFIPEAIQGYTTTLYRAETAEGDKLCNKLSDATIATFPDHPFAYNIKAALATAHGKQDEALRYLEIASSKAPNDPLILLNLGDTYLKAAQKKKAEKVYSRILQIKGIDDSYKETARKKIKSNKTLHPTHE